MKNKIDYSKIEFKCGDLTEYTDSLLFDTGETIATLEYKNFLIVIDVTGEKKIYFNDEVYTQAFDYPDELIENIKNGHIYDYQEDCYLEDNNWFDVVIFKNKCYIYDEVFEEDLCQLTPEKLKKIMIDYLDYAINL